MHVGYGGDQQEVHDCGHHTPEPAVLAGDGAQAVGEAQADGDGLGVDGHGVGAAGQAGQGGEAEGCEGEIWKVY